MYPGLEIVKWLTVSSLSATKPKGAIPNPVCIVSGCTRELIPRLYIWKHARMFYHTSTIASST